MLYSNNYKDNKKFAIEVFLPDIALIKLDFLRVVFAGVGGGVNLTPPSHFKKNLSNINITLYSC